MGEAPWGAIPVADEKAKYYACPLFRKEFQVKGEIRRATLYGSALGVYRLHINGRPVGNDYFTPDWTDYHKRVYYNTYDVTDLVKANGANAIGGVLGAGWYAGQICWAGQNIYGNRPRLFAQLEIELADGTIQTVATDGTWKTAFGPYIEGEFLAGETYDARKEIPGWASPGPMTVNWQPVAVTDSIPAKLQAFPGVTVQETGVLHPVKITEPKPGVFVFDLGQNFAGFARLKAQGPAGTKVVLRFAEMLNPDGTIYTTNLRGARAIDTYILKGAGRRGLAAAFHLPRLPLRRSDRLSGPPDRGRHHRHRHQLEGSAGGPVRVFQPDGQSALSEYRLDATGELHLGAHRLPATRRAAGLDGRRRDVRPRGHVQCRRGGLLHQVAGRSGGRPRAGGRFPRRGPDDSHHRRRLRRLGRRRHDLPLDHLPGLQRQAAPGETLRRDGPLGRVLPAATARTCCGRPPATAIGSRSTPTRRRTCSPPPISPTARS